MGKILAVMRVIYNSFRFWISRGNVRCAGKCTSRCGNEFTVTKGGHIDLGYHVCALKNCRFSAHGGVLKIGDNVGFNTNCIVACHKKIVIQDGVEFGPNVCIYDHDHDFRCAGGIKSGKFTCDEVYIGKNTWIGANVVILKGTHIGENCVIGAGCVVFGDVSDNTVVLQNRDTIKKSYYFNNGENRNEGNDSY